MKTGFHVREPYKSIFFESVNTTPCIGVERPLRFMRKMWTNTGMVCSISGLGHDENGLERKNPVIVALGDSVTAGHFEYLLTTDYPYMQKIKKEIDRCTADPDNYLKKKDEPYPPRIPAVEIYDSRESYIEKFREKLVDKYELSSISVINAGIAGDTLIGMDNRLERDVIQHQPDLVLINGSLNWDLKLGTVKRYKELLRGMVQKIKTKTDADIILLTPNGDLPNTMFGAVNPPETTTFERVKAIRELSGEEKVCLADVYAVWEKAREKGCPWVELLANGINHPAVEGHEVYAMVLMKLFEQQ